MPMVQADPVAMLSLFEGARRCMVRISEAMGDREERRGNGFVVYCRADFTVVAVHPSYKFQCLRNGKMFHGPAAARVTFCDGAKATNTTFIKLNHSINLIVARIALGDWRAVRFGQLSEHTRDDVLSVTSLFNQPVPFIGRIISQQALAVDGSGNVIPSSTYTFTFNLPMAGAMSKKEKELYEVRFEIFTNQVLGSPVFNFKGRLVGIVERCGTVFDFKFGTRSEELEEVISGWMGEKTWEEAVEPHINRDQHAGGSKRAKRN